jgi:hypothetical protein
MTHPAELDDQHLLRECEVRRTRGSGPGGQHRNKVETAIVISHGPSGVRGEASERRSQEANRQVALRRLRIRLAIEVRTQRDGQVPSALWQSRTKGGKLHVNENHEDFPAMLAEAIDCVAEASWDVAAAARRLACSSSQLVKFLQKEPAALTLVNRQRTTFGLRPLK